LGLHLPLVDCFLRGAFFFHWIETPIIVSGETCRRAHGITRAGPRCKTSACCTPVSTSVGGSAVRIPGLMHSGRLVGGLVELLERASGANTRSSAPREARWRTRGANHRSSAPGRSLAGSWNYSSGSEVQNLGLLHSGRLVGGSAVRIPCPAHPGEFVGGLVELLERVRGAKPRSSAPRETRRRISGANPRPVALRETRRRICGANPLSSAPGEVAQLLREEKM